MKSANTQHNLIALLAGGLLTTLAVAQLPDSPIETTGVAPEEPSFGNGASSMPEAEGQAEIGLNIFGETQGEQVWLTPEEELDEAQQRFLDYYAEGSYQRAIIAAGQTVELARTIHGYESLQAGLALGNLATAQSAGGERAAALTNYNASIYLLEENGGIISPRLVNPLLGLAATHNAMGSYDLGLAAYERALRINHVENGLFNIEQLKIRDGLTESYVGLGEMDDAGFEQEVQSTIVRQEYAGNLEMVLPAIYKLAEWYQRTNQPMREQQQYQFAVNILRQADGRNSPTQIEALRGLSAAYMRSNEYMVSIRLLKQAYRINDDSEARDPLLAADILVELGDTYNSFSSQRDARRTYKMAWELLGETQDADKQRDRYFGKPEDIWGLGFPGLFPDKKKTAEILQDDPDAFAVGLITVGYDINEYGRAKNIRIIESDPADLLDDKVKRLLSRNVYRPRMEDGETVLTSNLQLNHSFRYLKRKVAEQDNRDIEDKRLERPTR